jgi:hypothetical protein
MPRGIFLVAKDIMILEGYKTVPAAWQALKTICASIGKPRLTIDDYAAYYKIDVQQVHNALNPKLHKL